MIELLIGVMLGGLVAWIITYTYYKKSKLNIPSWAKPIIEKLPQMPPSQQELLELFRDSVTKGKVNPHPVPQHVACPICKAPASDFKEEVVEDGYQTVLIVACPHCGWSEHGEP